jgi:tRNA(fMet)-specific endonuclease VapC
MKRYLLDTNTVSYLIRGHETVTRRVVAVPITSLCISAVTEGELLYGLAKRPGAHKLQRAVGELLRRFDVLPWNGDAAQCYGPLRAKLEGGGRGLAPLDLLIAAHAASVEAVLVSSDQAFAQLPGLAVEDWRA